MDKIPLAQQITEAEMQARDLAVFVSRGGKQQSLAAHRHRAALAIISTLHWLKDHEAEIKAAIEERRQK
jgi:hypothetical protein